MQLTVLTCKPCTGQPINSSRAMKESSALERAREAVSRLRKTSFSKDRDVSKYVNAIETADIDLRNSKPTPRNPMERPFGSALERAKTRAAELRAM